MIEVSPSAATDRRFYRFTDAPVWLAIPTIAIAIGIILRMVLRSSASLWEDEVIAATHATQPLLRLLVNVIVNDIHPPLYFLELHIWSLLGQSDSWLIANSVVFSVAAIASIFVSIRRLSDTPRALVVTAVFAALPAAIWMAEEVRMYSMLSVLLIWTHYFTYKAFALPPGQSLGARIAVFLLSVAIIWTHAIGFVAVFFFGIFAATWLATRQALRREWLVWLAVFGGASVAAIPILVAGAIHKADMSPVAGLRDVAAWIASAIVGGGYKAIPWLQAAGLATYLMVAILGMLVNTTRRVTFCFIVAPLILCVIVGITARPLFKSNFFATFLSPFLAMVIGGLLVRIPMKRAARSLVLSCVIVGLLAMAIANRMTLNASNYYYRQAAEVIMENRLPGDALWVPQRSIFWGMAWYLAGPGWGSPVAISGPLRPQSGWWKVYALLGPHLLEKLELVPISQSIMTREGLPIMMGDVSQSTAERETRLWLVTYPRDDLPTGLPADNLGPLRHSKTFSFPPIIVSLYELP